MKYLLSFSLLLFTLIVSAQTVTLSVTLYKVELNGKKQKVEETPTLLQIFPMSEIVTIGKWKDYEMGIKAEALQSNLHGENKFLAGYILYFRKIGEENWTSIHTSSHSPVSTNNGLNNLPKLSKKDLKNLPPETRKMLLDQINNKGNTTLSRNDSSFSYSIKMDLNYSISES